MIYDHTPETDGITHINMYSRGKTQLGRDLSNFSYHPFVHPKFGRFVSLEGFWYWLLTENDELRDNYDINAKILGRHSILHSGKIERDPYWFRLAYMSAAICKLQQHPSLMKAFQDNPLPLNHYYVFNGVKTLPKQHNWIVPLYESLRTQ